MGDSGWAGAGVRESTATAVAGRPAQVSTVEEGRAAPHDEEEEREAGVREDLGAAFDYAPGRRMSGR